MGLRNSDVHKLELTPLYISDILPLKDNILCLWYKLPSEYSQDQFFNFGYLLASPGELIKISVFKAPRYSQHEHCPSPSSKSKLTRPSGTLPLIIIWFLFGFLHVTSLWSGGSNQAWNKSEKDFLLLLGKTLSVLLAPLTLEVKRMQTTPHFC